MLYNIKSYHNILQNVHYITHSVIVVFLCKAPGPPMEDPSHQKLPLSSCSDRTVFVSESMQAFFCYTM